MTNVTHSLNTFQQIANCRLVATSNQSGTYYNGPLNNGVGATFTYATGALTLDSVTVAVGDRILFMAQTSALQNGIYECTQAGATGVAAILQRAGDFQCVEEMSTGKYVYVSAGTLNAGSCYVVVEPVVSAVGTGSIIFAASPLNSNLGTAATKAASDNTKATVASVDSAVAVNRFAVFTDTAGTIDDTTAAAIHDGNIQAGLSGTAGTLSSFPSAATKGSLQLTAVANTGDTVTTISNVAMGQASVISIPDPATATANFAVAPAALVNNNLVKASGTAGLVADAGARLIANTTAAYAGGGTSNTFAAVGLTSSAKGSAVIRASTNSVSITKALPGADTLAITFSADPGAGTTVDYIYATASQA